LVTFLSDALAQDLGNSRFADAGLTTQEHYLSFAADGFAPTTIKE
jgi:hypothetical protein